MKYDRTKAPHTYIHIHMRQSRRVKKINRIIFPRQIESSSRLRNAFYSFEWQNVIQYLRFYFSMSFHTATDAFVGCSGAGCDAAAAAVFFVTFLRKYFLFGWTISITNERTKRIEKVSRITYKNQPYKQPPIYMIMCTVWGLIIWKLKRKEWQNHTIWWHCCST